MHTRKSSRLPEFHKQPIEQRVNTLASHANLTDHDTQTFTGSSGLSTAQANDMIENAVGIFSLPLGIATNFLINGKDYLIPMAIEEPSVIAACSHAAKLFRTKGGLTASSELATMAGQIQLLEITDIQEAQNVILNHRERILDEANKTAISITRRGGGARDIQTRVVDTTLGTMLVIHLPFNVQDAMGANAINTATEHIAPILENLTGGRAVLRILSNLSDQRKAQARGTIPANELQKEDLSGEEVITRILEASTLAEHDPYRAATHNKGIMNGIDAILIATGNDWRAVEAGAHAFAARGGSYTSLTHWRRDENGDLQGTIELPLAVGIVGGATRVHPTAQVALKILGVESVRELAEVIAAVGLAQNLAAIRALATDGIQQGHMRLHAKQLAAAAGASGNMILEVTRRMIAEQNIRLERARELVTELKGRE